MNDNLDVAFDVPRETNCALRGYSSIICALLMFHVKQSAYEESSRLLFYAFMLISNFFMLLIGVCLMIPCVSLFHVKHDTYSDGLLTR